MKTNARHHSDHKAKTVSPVSAAGKAKRRRHGPKAAAVLESLEQINLHACGIDVG